MSASIDYRGEGCGECGGHGGHRDTCSRCPPLARPDRLDMTLRDFFTMTDRVGSAAQTIRDAQAMMGGPVQRSAGGVIEVAPGDYSHPLAGRTVPDRDRMNRPLVSNKPVEWTPEELAKKDKLRLEREAAVLAQMPDDVRALK